jgi:excisionase family DNA binding protein
MVRQIPNIPTQEKIALRINETVAVSGLSRSTIYELLKAGKLRAVKIGGRCGASIWMRAATIKMALQRSRRGDDCRAATITQEFFS